METPTNNTSSFLAFNEIVSLVDHGASLFWAQKYKETCSTLTRALEMYKEMLVSEMTCHRAQQESDRNSNENLCTETSSSSSTTAIHSCEERTLLPPLLNFVMARQSTHGGIPFKNDLTIENTSMADGGIWSWQVDKHQSIHACPMLLTVQSRHHFFELVFGTVPPRDPYYLTFSLIIIFNLALSHHLHALDQIKEGCSLSSRCSLLNRTYLLYQNCKALLCQMQLQHQSSCWFLSYVIFNNEAQVLLMMGEHQEAASLLQAILSYLCWLNLQRRGGIDDLVPVAALETFVHNTSHMILKRVITSPAA